MKYLRYRIGLSLVLLPWMVAGALVLSSILLDLFLESLMQRISAILSWPSSVLDALNNIEIAWERILSVRRGFLLGAIAGFSIVGSILWAIPEVSSFLPNQFVEPVIPPASFMPIARAAIPSELSWFFIQFPYLSESSQTRAKNHHTFIVTDAQRRRNYVVNFGQRFRRVEIYSQDTKELQVQVFTPGSKRVVVFQGPRVVSQETVADGNLWMWKSPLWNAEHYKIYGQADMWLDSPYKRYSCAGFVHRFLKDANVDVPILDAWDMAKLPWVRVPMEELEPGDIITIKALTAQHRRFWGHRVTHVGVYIGNGKIIHAATSSVHSTRSWVRIADLDEFRGRIDKVLRAPELL